MFPNVNAGYRSRSNSVDQSNRSESPSSQSDAPVGQNPSHAEGPREAWPAVSLKESEGQDRSSLELSVVVRHSSSDRELGAPRAARRLSQSIFSGSSDLQAREFEGEKDGRDSKGDAASPGHSHSSVRIHRPSRGDAFKPVSKSAKDPQPIQSMSIGSNLKTTGTHKEQMLHDRLIVKTLQAKLDQGEHESVKASLNNLIKQDEDRGNWILNCLSGGTRRPHPLEQLAVGQPSKEAGASAEILSVLGVDDLDSPLRGRVRSISSAIRSDSDRPESASARAFSDREEGDKSSAGARSSRAGAPKVEDAVIDISDAPRHRAVSAGVSGSSSREKHSPGLAASPSKVIGSPSGAPAASPSGADVSPTGQSENKGTPLDYSALDPARQAGAALLNRGFALNIERPQPRSAFSRVTEAGVGLTLLACAGWGGNAVYNDGEPDYNLDVAIPSGGSAVAGLLLIADAIRPGWLR